MPGIPIPDPTPSWLRPENASVLDPWWRRVARALNPITGADDPTSQVMGLATTLVEGPAAALTPLAARARQAAVDLLERAGLSFPGGAPSIITGHTGRGGPIGGTNPRPLVDLILPTDVPGRYRLRDEVIERMQQIFELGADLPQVSNWRGITDQEVIRAFGGEVEAAKVWARMWGATSPNTSVPVNTREAVIAFREWLNDPTHIYTPANIRALGLTNTGAKAGNLNNAPYLTGIRGDPGAYDLSGSGKAHAMAEFMLGKPRAPIDVHVLHAVGSTLEKFDPQRTALKALMQKLEGQPLGNEEIYFRFEQALNDALQQIAPGQDFNQVFGQFWEGARASKGLTFQGGPIDMMRSAGLMDYGAMLDPRKLTAALRIKSWSPVAIAGLLTAMGVGAGAGGSATPDGGPPPPPGSYVQH